MNIMSIMKKRFLTLALVCLAAAAFGQTTPKLHFNVPTPGTQVNNWGSLLNANAFTLESYLTGGSTLNGLNENDASANGVFFPAACGLSFPPSWCSGSDMGAWTNAAIAATPGCGEVYIAAGTYSQSTSIVKPRCVKLARRERATGTVLSIHADDRLLDHRCRQQFTTGNKLFPRRSD